ncbi:MAG: winged helix-turn-helix domain-containing protein [Deltaproteobacteria bacterium]|nr:winged helix-turn-helix domain-containing protein [Deltaproteobacteria bacterium]
MNNHFLKEGVNWALLAVCCLPLISAGELAAILGVAHSTASRQLKRLEEQGLVESVVMGALLPAAARYHLTPAGAKQFLEPEVYFQLPRNINRLAAMLPAVECFYRTAAWLPSNTQIGEFRSFHWRLRDGVDAVAHYENGSVAFVWSGPWQTAKHFESRLEDFANSDSVAAGWPALVCVIASDFWQTFRVTNAVSGFGLGEGWMVACTETDEIIGDLTLSSPPNFLGVRPLLGAEGNTVSTELPRMLRGVRAGKDAHMAHRVLCWVEQFPAAQIASIARALGSHRRYVSATVARLVKDGTLAQCEGHLYLADEALKLSAHRDRVHVSRLRRRFGLRDDGLPAAARYRSHDGAASGIVATFKGAGFPVAGGWRGEDYSGGQNAIAPDALILMGDGFSGRVNWWCFEYERRANSAASVSKKLRGYLARREASRVLVAARNPTMADEFRRQAAAASYPLLAASIQDIRIEEPQNVWGTQTVWKDAAGISATLRPPQWK